MSLMSLTYLASVLLIVVSSNIAPILSSLNVPRSPLVRIGVIGDKVELNCSVNENDSASWTYTSLTQSTETHLYLGGDIVVSLKSRYRIDKTISGQHNLIINSVDLTHAGRYQCSGVQLSLINDIELTVLASHPVCAENVSAGQDEDKKQRYLHVFIWCSVNYTGSGFPVFNWTKSNAEKSIVANTTTSGTDQVGLPVIKTSSIIEQLQANDSGVTLTCRIAFQMPNNTQGINIFTWNYKPHGPINLSIVEYEDRLECSADGNPAPTYKWILVERNISTDGSVFALNDTVTFAKDYTFQCTAANLFVAENINITITAKDSGLTQGDFDFPFPITTLAIGLALLSLLTIAIIIACIFNRKRLKGDTSHRPDVVALTTDLNSYEEIVLNCDRSPNYNLNGDQLPGTSDERTISDNAVYSEVLRSRGRLNGSNAGNIGEYSRPPQTQTRKRKTLIGADGTEYAELSGVKPPVRKDEVGLPKPPAFSRVEVYASIDHNGRAPPPPPTL